VVVHQALSVVRALGKALDGGRKMSTAGDESAGAADTAPEAASAQGGRLRRPVAIVIQAGSVAAALGSIFGLVILFMPSLNPTTAGSGTDKVSTVLPDGAEITLAVERDVERVTYGRWLELETGSREGATPEEQSVPGVNVHYTAEFPAYASGAPFRARFTLKDQTNAAKDQHVTKARLDADRDTCRCAEFVPVPTGPSSYRVLVELYRPGEPYAAPVLAKYTDWFSAAEPVTS
jgi:hypothetical protein